MQKHGKITTLRLTIKKNVIVSGQTIENKSIGKIATIGNVLQNWFDKLNSPIEFPKLEN